MIIKKIKRNGLIRLIKIGFELYLSRLRGIFFGLINSKPKFPKGLRVGRNVRSTVRHLELGENISIGDLCSFGGVGKIVLENNVVLNRNVHMDSTEIITIGYNTLIGPDCYFVDSNHILKNKSKLVSSETQPKPILVQDNVWIGRNVTILAGCNIGTKSILAAGAVITKTVPSNSIAKGVPAKTQII